MNETTIRDAIAKNERASIEFKSVARRAQGICKEIAAFATSQGGTLLIGVDNDRDILGVEKSVEVRDRIERWIYEHIAPAPAFDIQIVNLDEKDIIAVLVANGTAPFYNSHDIPYIRIGTSSQPIKPQHLIDLVRGRTVEDVIKSMESTLAVMQTSISVTQSMSETSRYIPASAIDGQGELATMQYQQVRDRIFSDLPSAPVIAGLESSVAVAQSIASIAELRTAPHIENQGDLATMNYAELVARFINGPELSAALSQSEVNSVSAMATALAATAKAQAAMDEINRLKAQLRTITS